MLLRELKKLSSGTRFLDFGCGDCQLLKDAQAEGFEIYGTDIERRIQSKVESIGGNWISLQDLGSYTKSFDIITMFQSIEHLQNPVEELKTLQRLLSPGGLLVIETPSPDGLDFRSFDRKYWGGFHAPRHYFIASFSGLHSFLSGIGYDVRQHKYIPSPYTWAETLRAVISQTKFRHLGNRLFSIDNPVFLITVALFETFTLFFNGKSSNQRIIVGHPQY